jgi:hypothetical protein
MNNYITLDGKKYTTAHRSWKYRVARPVSARVYLDGSLGAAYSPAAVHSWQGEIKGPVTADTGWGTILDLRASLAKLTRLSYTDHYGTVFANAVVAGSFEERSLSPKWDGPSNVIFVQVEISSI